MVRKLPRSSSHQCSNEFWKRSLAATQIPTGWFCEPRLFSMLPQELATPRLRGGLIRPGTLPASGETVGLKQNLVC